MLLAARRAPLSVLSAAALAACAEPPIARERPASVASAISGGAASPASEDEVVLVATPLGASATFMCTGTLVAPNLVLFARHCVSAGWEAPFGCNADGTVVGSGGVFTSDRPAAGIEVFTGAPRKEPGVDAPSGVGKKLFRSAGPNICQGDLALLLLEQDVPNAKIARLRLDGPPVAGEAVVGVGYGLQSASSFPATRLTRETTIGALGATFIDVPGTQTQMGVPAGAFSLTAGFGCQGDSGGPVLAKDTRAVVGVASFAGPTCGADQFTIYRSTFQERELIAAAFAESGHTPRGESDADDPGDPGGGGDRGDGASNPDDEDDDERASGRAPATATDSGGCAAGGASAPGALAPIAAALAAIGLVRRRRGRA